MFNMMQAHLSPLPDLRAGFERLYKASVFAGRTGTVEEVLAAHGGTSTKTRAEWEADLRLLL